MVYQASPSIFYQKDKILIPNVLLHLRDRLFFDFFGRDVDQVPQQVFFFSKSFTCWDRAYLVSPGIFCWCLTTFLLLFVDYACLYSNLKHKSVHFAWSFNLSQSIINYYKWSILLNNHQYKSVQYRRLKKNATNCYRGQHRRNLTWSPGRNMPLVVVPAI